MKKEKKNLHPKYDKFLIFTLCLTLILFIRSVGFDILNFDDNEYFNDYPEIKKFSLSNLIAYFTRYYVLMYQPLPVLSFAIIGQHAFLHHLLNLAFHIFNIFLVYKICDNLQLNSTVKNITTFLCAVHPLAVEPVMWISSRSSLMYACFYLIGIIFYLKYNKFIKRQYLYYCIFFFVLSLFSKVHAVSFPITLLIFDIFILKKQLTFKLLIEKWHFFILSLIFGIVALLNTETTANIEFSTNTYSYFDYFFILTYEIIWYIFKIFVPLDLSPIYVYPPKTDGFLPIVYYLSALGVCVLGYFIYKFRKQYQFLIFGILFFYSSLIFVFQIIPSRLFIVADRYGYIANIGVFLIISEFIYSYKNRSKYEYSGYAIALIIIVLSFFQTSIWQNDKTLSERIISSNPETYYIARAYGIRANYYKDKEKKPEIAIRDYIKASELDTNDWISPYQAALIYSANGETQEAILYFKKSIKTNSKSPLPYTDLGVLLSSLNEFTQAETAADSALKYSSFFANAMLLKAVCRLNFKDSVKAINILNTCIVKNPHFSPAYKNRGIILYNNFNKPDSACLDFTKANELGEPGMADIISYYCNKK